MIDLVMWTLNGGDTLDRTLGSIEKGIHEGDVCHRTIIDGGSTDSTVKIARNHGWSVYVGYRGIARQANQALSMIDTDFFASFEQDILLSPRWLEKMLAVITQPDVAVSQGIRLSVGSPTVAAMDRDNFSRTLSMGALASLDNTLYKTRIIRLVGGYRASTEPRKGTDSLLLESVREAGYKWNIDETCISGHLRPNLAYHLRHCLRSYQLRLWQQGSIKSQMSVLATSPLRGAKMAAKYHSPQVLLGYPVFRWTALVAGFSGIL